MQKKLIICSGSHSQEVADQSPKRKWSGSKICKPLKELTSNKRTACHLLANKMTADSYHGDGSRLNRLNMFALSSFKPVVTNGRMVCKANVSAYHHDVFLILNLRS